MRGSGSKVRHAAVVGPPGSGKSTIIQAAFIRIFELAEKLPCRAFVLDVGRLTAAGDDTNGDGLWDVMATINNFATPVLLHVTDMCRLARALDFSRDGHYQVDLLMKRLQDYSNIYIITECSQADVAAQIEGGWSESRFVVIRIDESTWIADGNFNEAAKTLFYDYLERRTNATVPAEVMEVLAELPLMVKLFMPHLKTPAALIDLFNDILLKADYNNRSNQFTIDDVCDVFVERTGLPRFRLPHPDSYMNSAVVSQDLINAFQSRSVVRDILELLRERMSLAAACLTDGGRTPVAILLLSGTLPCGFVPLIASRLFGTNSLKTISFGAEQRETFATRQFDSELCLATTNGRSVVLHLDSVDCCSTDELSDIGTMLKWLQDDQMCQYCYNEGGCSSSHSLVILSTASRETGDSVYAALREQTGLWYLSRFHFDG